MKEYQNDDYAVEFRNGDMKNLVLKARLVRDIDFSLIRRDTLRYLTFDNLFHF